MCHFRAQNGALVMNKFFLVQAIIVTFIYLLALFTVQNFKKLLQWIPSYKDMPFLGPKWSICPKTNFFLENYQYHSHLPISPFHCAKLKKNPSSRSRVMRMRSFWAQNSPFPQMIIFFRKTLNEPFFLSFMSIYMPKIKADINLLVKYWWLKNTATSLAESHFGYSLRTRFFPSMQFSQNVNEPYELSFYTNSRQN